MEIITGTYSNSTNARKVNFITEEYGADYNILNIKDVAPGTVFRGIVYALDSRTVENKFKKGTYNIIMKLIDGSGVIFTGTMFEVEENNLTISNRAVLIEEGFMTNRFDSKNFYNISKIRTNLNQQIPINLFLKQIDNLQALKQIINERIEIFRNSENSFYNALQQYNIIERLSQTTLSDDYGTKIGDGLNFIEIAYDMIYKYKIVKITEKTKLSESQLRDKIFKYLILKVFYISSTNSLSKDNTKEYSTKYTDFLNVVQYTATGNLIELVNIMQIISGTTIESNDLNNELSKNVTNIYNQIVNLLK